ncbi:MAG: DEAD/DEAH box helicase, partial [Micrococcales bacterium]|nr:DEAD/DEAH box helicase [Micrococcales bacterium]
SPLKALATDVERNLRSPLVGIGQAAARSGVALHDVSVSIRTGDTPPAQRRAFATRPSDVLITTPESLFLVLTSAARAGLAGVQTVIVDEIHALAGTKRGAHLALSLERLDELADDGPVQRIGLSATVRPVTTVARFLAGGREPHDGGRAVTVVAPPSTKQIEVQVAVAVPDLSDLTSASEPDVLPASANAAMRRAPRAGRGDGAPSARMPENWSTPSAMAVPAAGGAVRSSAMAVPAEGGAVRSSSVWPHVHERVVDLVAAHRSTLVFTNSRRGAERLTSRINEIWAERHGGAVPDPQAVHPAEISAQSGTSAGVDTRDAAVVLARAHHGSMSRAERTRTESELKAGLLPAVVATSSLELGIDMGAVDLVVQVGAPPSVASGLQRIGRAGHQVGAVSRGVVFPTFRGELVAAAVIAERMAAGAIEELHVPANPLDVLAQQVVAMVAVDDWSVQDLARTVRRAAPFTTLGDATLRAVLDMLSGRYPSEDFAELRPRLVWDRVTDRLTARPGALRLAVTSGGTIPDRGLFGVFLAGSGEPEGVMSDVERTGGRARGGRRVGELDEEMVFESRVGDMFTLGSSTWRIEEITPDRVLVTPAPGVPGRLPFWRGDAPGRPAELGEAMGAWVRTTLAQRTSNTTMPFSPPGSDAATTPARTVETVPTETEPAETTVPTETVTTVPTEPAETVGTVPTGTVPTETVTTVPTEPAETVGTVPTVLPGFRQRRSPGNDCGTVPTVSAPPTQGETTGPLDPWATNNLLAYLDAQREATGEVPTDEVVVVERFRDELGDWRIVIHSPYGAAVHAPWALVVAGRLRERFGDVAAMHSDDGIVLRLPDTGDMLETSQWDDPRVPRAATGDGPAVDVDDLLIDPDEVVDAVRAQLAGSALFAARFREAAARSLLLPRRRPDRRQPLWQQRHRAAQLLSVAAGYPDFPVVLEAVRECLCDDFDTAALTRLMTDLRSRKIRVHEVTTARPSPFAQSLLFGYTAQFLYDGDAPLAERRVAALTLDPALLAELLGGGGTDLADLLDPAAVIGVEAELAGRPVDSAEGLADVLRRHGPLPLSQIQARVPTCGDEIVGWLDDLVAARRVIAVRLAGVAPDDTDQWAAIEDAGRLRDALGVALPVGIPEVFTEPVPDPLGDLVRRHARTHGPFPPAAVATRFGLGVAVVNEAAARLERAGVLVRGALRPEELGGVGDELCDADVLRMVRRRSLATLRAQVEPVPQQALGVFLPRWQGVRPVGGAGTVSATGGLHGVDGLARVVEQLAGVVLPASAVETHILPARIADYTPAMLDELMVSGEVLWSGHGRLGTGDALVALHPAATADLTLPAADPPPGTPLHTAVLAALAGGGGWLLTPLTAQVANTLHNPGPDGEPPSPTPVTETSVADALWDLVWSGLVTNDAWAPLRAWLSTGRTAHRTRTPTPRGRSQAGRLSLRPTPIATVPPRGMGRWSVLPPREPDATIRAHATAAQLLDRHGVFSRAVAGAEGLTGAQLGAVYRVLRALEESGQVRRGYFVEHLGGSQFALPGAVDRLRTDAQTAEPPPDDAHPRDPHVVVLAAADPANPYGAALAWPGREGHRPGRKAGALAVLADGALAAYVERGAHTLLTWTQDPTILTPTAHALAAVVPRTGRLTIARIDAADVPGPATDTPAARALRTAGFRLTPRGLRLSP